MGKEFNNADKGKKFSTGGHMATTKMGKPTMKPGMSTAKDGMKKPTPMANTSMMGMKKKLTSAKTANDPDSRINKSLRAWNC